MSDLVIENLHVNVGENEILRGVNLTIEQGKVHALMGPNGSGKSTLAYSLMGHPNYDVKQGKVLYKGENVLEKKADERSHLGIFLAFQYPVAIPGVTVANFLRTALNAHRKALDPKDKGITIPDFRKQLKEKMDLLKMDHAFAARYLNDGFSGGEKKRVEILQMATLEPSVAVMDETDSGLDIDALRNVAEGVQALRGPNFSALVITHYQRILNYMNPDYVHILFEGRVVESGGPELAHKLEERGYDWIREKHGQKVVA
jgi:Fe-S cluster assembly ATP-binding protein